MRKSLNKKSIYFNLPQRMAMHVQANTEYHVWARRTGKTHGLTGPRSLTNTFAMPRSMGAWLTPTFKMALTQTLPATLQVWDFFGWKEGVHYLVGKRPPSKWKWPKPFIEPRNYEHVIAWFNGSVHTIISQDRVGSSNSYSLDWIIGDEAKFLNYDRLKSETLPALSGSIRSIQLYRNNPRFKSKMFCTDMPILQKNKWILEKEKDMESELIQLILALRKKLSKTKSEVLASRYRRELDHLRSKAVFYSEASILDNIHIVGENYVADQHRDLPNLEFQTALLNLRLGKLEDGFYSNLDEYLHYYSSSAFSYLDNLEYNFEKLSTRSWLMDGDLDITQPLKIAFDYNANINWMVVGQVIRPELRTVNSFYVKNQRKLVELCNEFADYYQTYPIKMVDYYYDVTAINTNYAIDDKDFRQVVIDTLSKRGWYVNDLYIGKQMRHDLKHLYINQAFQGQDFMFPRFNLENNEILLAAMEMTGVRIGRNGFEKDKTGEKVPETDQDPLELRTDGTDAWDTLFIGCTFFPAGISDQSTANTML